MTDLEDALDGLQAAESYCEEAGLESLGEEAADLYQRIAQEAPPSDWDDREPDIDDLMQGDE